MKCSGYSQSLFICGASSAALLSSFLALSVSISVLASADNSQRPPRRKMAAQLQHPHVSMLRLNTSTSDEDIEVRGGGVGDVCVFMCVK